MGWPQSRRQSESDGGDQRCEESRHNGNGGDGGVCRACNSQLGELLWPMLLEMHGELQEALLLCLQVFEAVCI